LYLFYITPVIVEIRLAKWNLPSRSQPQIKIVKDHLAKSMFESVFDKKKKNVGNMIVVVF
jgi:hypothetical protein